MEVIYLYSEELDTLQELNEVTNSKLIEIANKVSKELTERLNGAWDKLPNFKGDPTTKCEEVDELFAQNNLDGVVDFNNMISGGGRIRNLPRRDIAKDAIPTEDCISRQAAIKVIMSEPMNEPRYPTWWAGKIKSLPPVEPERPKGEWIKSYFNECCGTDENHNPVFRKTPCVKCDQCGKKRRDEEKFCPECGADMRGGKK